MSETDTLSEQKTLSPAQRALLEKWMGGALKNRQPLIPRRSRQSPAPLSFAQQRLWFLDQLEPGSAAYHMPAAVRLVGVLDIAALEQAINEMLKRHEVLRTTFSSVDQEPVQLIAPAQTIALSIVDLSEQPEPERKACGLQLAADETRRPFDLAHGPLLRAVLLRLNVEEHILLLTIHHIISDGWSLSILVREMIHGYQSLTAGKPLALPELPIQYADFAAWQRQWLQDEVLAAQLAYWKRQLVDLPVLELPPDRSRPAEQTFRGVRRSLKTSLPLAEKLQALSNQAQVTLFTTLLAAFKLLLWRHTGQTDIVIGTPIAGRNRAEIEDLIGFFINTLVLRTDLTGPLTFRGLLERVRETTLEAYAHQDLPFEKLVEELEPQRDLSRTPLFQVFFNMLNIPASILKISGLLVEPLLAPDQIGSKFDLTAYAEVQDDGIQLELVYNADLYDPQHITEFLEQFQLLLTQVAEHPEKEISAYSLVTARAEKCLPDPSLPLKTIRSRSIPAWFSRQARQFPEHLAVVDAHEHWTYRELETRSNQLAHYLRTNGIQSQDIVAVYAHRSASLVWAILGILKAGAAFTILDPAYPPARLSTCIQKARPKALLWIEAAGELPECLRSFTADKSCRCSMGLPGLSAATASEFLAGYSVEALTLKIRLDDLAYLVFTSGTTGIPKGILGSHRPLTHFLQWHIQTFGLDHSDRFSMLSGLSHDPLLRDIFTPLCLGATLSIPDPEQIGSPDLGRWMEQEKISVTHLTPAMGQLLYTVCKATTLSSLRYAFFGGDILTQTDISHFRVLAPSSICVNLYGATETPQAMGYFVAAREERLEAGNSAKERPKEVIPLGQGIKDVQLLVLNPAKQLAGIGEVGEIYIRTPYLAKGYLDDETLTQERFLSNPFTGRAGDRLFKSGDQGRYTANGNIEFLGRADLQVKIRSFRVELEEIEAVLAGHPAIRNVAVAVYAGEHRYSEELVAYIVPRDRAVLTVDDLRRFLQDRLPDYMIPAILVNMERLPLTPNGKIDRRALPAPGRERPDLKQALIMPRTTTEEVLAGIWAQILRRKQVGIHDNFFELGGHSLLATQVVSRIRDAFRVELPLRTLFKTPTVAGLSEQLEQCLRGGRALPAPPLKAAKREETAPLSFAQQRLWFLHQLQPGSSAYHIPMAVHLKGRLHSTVLEQSLNTVMRRHEILQTTFALVNGQAVQKLKPALTILLPIVDLCQAVVSARESETERIAFEEARKPFDLAQGPMVRATLLRLAEEEYVLFLTMHHIVSDAWSTEVFIREAAATYQALRAGEPSPLPALPFQYADFAVWQRKGLQGEVLREHMDYWKHKLHGMPSLLELPTDRPRPATQSFKGARRTFVLPGPLAEALLSLSQSEGVTLFMTLLAAFKTLLYRYTAQTDIVLGSPIANRNRSEIEPLIGFFVNTLVLRDDLSGNPPFRELLKRVYDSALEAYTHQDLPFEMLVEELRPERDLSHMPLFQVMFVLQNAPPAAIELPDLTMRPLEIDRGTSKFDLTLFMQETGPGLSGIFEYNTDLFDAATPARLIGHFLSLLQGIVAHSDRRLSDLPLLTEIEKQRLLVEWNNTQSDYRQNQCVHGLFEAQAEQTPDTAAVIFPLDSGLREEHHLTYRELNRRANQLAHHLREQGVGPDMSVGLCLNRSVEMMIGLLGILKAGGAYVPLDPGYPPERLKFMLEDSKARVLLTQSSLLSAFSLPLSAAGLAKADQHLMTATRHQHLMTATRHQPSSFPIVCLDTDWEIIARQSRANPPIGPLSPENLVYVIYTSGSTGEPKGVMIRHDSVLNLLKGLEGAIYAHHPGDRLRISLNAPLTFDSSVKQLVMLLPGHTLCMIPQDVRLDANAFLSYLRRLRLDVLDCVPSQLKLLLPELLDQSEWLPGLVLLGGEAIDEALWQALAQAETIGFYNVYGPTECTVDTTIGRVQTHDQPSLGRPIANFQHYIVDQNLQPLPVGVPGELLIGGKGLARGYFSRPELTAEKFIPNFFSRQPGERLYRTGDLVRYLPDGRIAFLGRLDSQVKIRGFRIEPGEIEAILKKYPTVREVMVVIHDAAPAPGDTVPGRGRHLIAYVVPRQEGLLTAGELRNFLKEKLPDYMLPSVFMIIEALPLMANGKVDRRALPMPDLTRLESGTAYVAPRSEVERRIAAVWQEILGIDYDLSVNDNFFDLGGHSLLVMQVHERLKAVFHREISMTDMFRYTTIAALADYLEPIREKADPSVQRIVERVLARQAARPSPDIAVVGMTGRFPGANNIAQFWENLRQEKESITFFKDAELLAAGADPAWLKNPDYVKAGAILTDVDCFDARFFSINPREAEMTDPQQRIFLECAWQALENAGYDPEQYPGRIGIYGGASIGTYLLNNLYYNQDHIGAIGVIQTTIGNDKDFLATRVSYKLNLIGPSVTVQTACSTSLVAVHGACQSLLNHECDMALAGGISLILPQGLGYFYQPDGIASPDGHCRPFDAKAQGTVGGNGVGIVVLKRLADALKDGDTIHAVIKGSAINNDGARKIGYTAPSEDGQTEVIVEALATAQVDPETITYVESHGTGTVLGDPIEMAALTRAFQTGTQAKQFCALGSVKSNIGHLDVAAGVAGLIKTVLALEHKQLPASLHFTEPNPGIDFANSPFYVNARLQDWTVPDGRPRRAGVSSFGIGGTNVHAVLEEAPEIFFAEARRPYQLLLISAKTAAALDQATANLCEHLEKNPEINMADMAYTLQAGRRSFEHRRMLVCQGSADALQVFRTSDPTRLLGSIQSNQKRPVAFMFPGIGDHYIQMARELYHQEPVFRKSVDQCCELLQPLLEADLRSFLYPEEADRRVSSRGIDLPQMLGRDQTTDSQADERLNQAEITPSAVFVVEYALTELLKSWGLVPDALIGYGLGEYVAACVAGVFSLQEALTLVVRRAQMIRRLPEGSMLAVALPEAELRPFLSESIYLAIVSSPTNCVLAGPPQALASLGQQLSEKGIACRPIETTQALHSPAMEPLAAEFTALVRTMRLRKPQIPYLSNVTGDWISAEEATDPAYWARHLCQTVRFEDGLATLLSERDRILLEIGPGQSLCAFAKQHPTCSREQLVQVLPTLRYAYDRQSDTAFLLGTLGKLWLTGLQVDWPGFYGDERRRRMPLPGYPFARERYWVEPGQAATDRPALLSKTPNIEEWFYLPSWKSSAVPAPGPDPSTWLIFDNGDPFGIELTTRLQAAGHRLDVVQAGGQYDASAAHHYILNPQQTQDYLKLIAALIPRPQHIVYCVNEAFDFYGLLFLIQALAHHGLTDVRLDVITSRAQQVMNGEKVDAAQALAFGPVLVASQEYPELTCRSIDAAVPAHPWLKTQFYSNVLAELTARTMEPWVAYRDGQRWVPQYDRVQPPPRESHRLREKGVYLITGGLGRIGRVLARHLADKLRAKLVLINRSVLPPRSEWVHWLEVHDPTDPVSDRIRFVQALEEQGAEVLVLAADVAERDQMQAAIKQARQRFGALHGVLHLAGIVGAEIFVPIQDLTKPMCEAQLHPKVQGTQVLAEVLRDQDLDFCLLFSSMSAWLGGLGFAAYAAANRFMDAFAQQQNRTQATPWLSVNWDTWRFAGQEKALRWGAGSAELSMSPVEGVQAFERALGFGGLTRVMVTIGDLQERLQRWVTRPAATAGQEETALPSGQHARPALQNAYVAPRNDIEIKLAAIWEQLLGVVQVGVHDNFLELGGHSLLATQLLSRVRDAFHLELPMYRFFESPTIAELALDIVRKQLGDTVTEEELAAMLVEVERPDHELSVPE